MSTATTTDTQIYRVYIRATPQAVWDAITQPEWQVKYGYRAPTRYELHPGGAAQGLASEEMKAMGTPDVLIEGEVLEVDPPHKLVQTWHPLWTPEMIDEGPKRLTWEIQEMIDGLTMLTVTHELEGAPATAALVSSIFSTDGGGGWAWILNDLKSVLETGVPLGG